MQVEAIYEPQRKMDAIAFSVFSLRLYPQTPSEEFCGALDRLLEKSQWVVEKKTKRGVSTIDIRPYVAILESHCTPQELFLQVRLPSSQNFSLNPNLLISLLEREADAQDCLAQVRRLGVYDEQGEPFQ